MTDMLILVAKPQILFGQLHTKQLALADSKGISVGSVLSAYGYSYWKHFSYTFKFELPLDVAFTLACSSNLKVESEWVGSLNLESGLLSGSVDQLMLAMLELCTTTNHKIIRAVFNTINTYFEEDKIQLPIKKLDVGDGTYAIVQRG